MSGKTGRPPSTEPDKSNKVDLRLPEGLKALVQNQATKDNRSMNGQIVHYVEAGLEGIDATTLAHAVLEMQADIRELRERLKEK